MLNNNIKILLVSFVHHIELQNFLNAPRMFPTAGTTTRNALNIISNRIIEIVHLSNK